MTPAERGKLLSDVKCYLNITWNDEATERRIGGLIDDGMAYINDKGGGPADYLTPVYARTLLFDYVRYARDEALDVFENNYLSLILAFQNNEAVKRYDAAQSAEQETG